MHRPRTPFLGHGHVGWRSISIVAGLLVLLALPMSTLAHADLVSSSPVDGEVVDAGEVEVVLTFDEAVVGNSSFGVLDGDGATVASGGPDPTEPTVMRVSIPQLGAGTYTVQWTSVAEDGDVEHGTFTFAVAVPAPPIPTATPEPTTAASDNPTTEPSEARTAASPTPSSSGGGEPGSDATADYLFPIVIAGLLIGGGLAWFLRRRSAA